METTEIREFTEQVEKGGEASMTSVSLIISILAVLVAIVTVVGHREHTEAVLLQARASDQWNEYQARRLRIMNLTVESELLTLQPASAQEAAIKDKIEKNKGTIEKWQSEIDANAEKARDYEAEVARSERKASKFDLAEALLQIGVVLASITLLTRHWRYVFAALALAVAGVILGAWGFLLH